MKPISRKQAPFLWIDYTTVSIGFREDEIQTWTDDERKCITIPREAFLNWIKENYEELLGGTDE